MGEKNFVDLYCGGGGFSLGASLAGFKNALSVDLDKTLTYSYKKNFPQSNLIIADLSNGIDLSSQINANERVDVVIGGPPCQGFSLIGKRSPTDPRNLLLHHFFHHINDLNPKAFIMENVEGIISGYAIEILNDALQLVTDRYKLIGPIKVKASDFGAATTRPRIIVIGYDPSCVNSITEQDIEQLKSNDISTVKDAIADIPEPIQGKLSPKEFDWTNVEPEDERTISEYAKEARTLPPKGVGWEVALRYFSEEKISGLYGTNHTTKVINRFKEVQMGKVDKISRFPRLDWSKPSNTLRAGTGPEKGGFQSMRPLHPIKPRVITVREAARIQGFPDWFVFHPTKWHSFRMIGNSVSPIFSKKIMLMLNSKIGD